MEIPPDGENVRVICNQQFYLIGLFNSDYVLKKLFFKHFWHSTLVTVTLSRDICRYIKETLFKNEKKINS